MCVVCDVLGHSLDDLDRPGRPYSVDPHFQMAAYKHTVSSTVAGDLCNVNHTTITRTAHHHHYTRQRKKKKPLLTQKKAAARLSFAIHHISNNTLFYNVLFSDECMVQCINNEWEIVHESEERSILHTVQHPLSLMVWGGVCYNGRTNIKIYENETINAHTYTQTIIECYMANGFICAHFDHLNCLRPGVYLLQDNARPHTAHYTTSQFHKLNIITFDHYPATSPDLNIIEHIWAWMKMKIKAHSPRTKDELKSLIVRYWNFFPQPVIQRMIAEYHLRLFDVILNKGWHTDY